MKNRIPGNIWVGLGTAGAVIAGGEAQAAVIDWQGNIVIPANIDGLYIKVDTQQTLAGAGAGLPGWDLNPYGASALQFFNSTGGGQMRYPGVTAGPAGSLPVGTLIGPTGSWNTATTAVSFGSSAGQWSLNAVNYMGFRFVADGGTTHYAWAAIQVGAAATDRTFVSLNWETTPDTAMYTGSLVTGQPAAVPETSTVAAGALAGLAVGARFVLQRRRRATAQQACSVEA